MPRKIPDEYIDKISEILTDLTTVVGPEAESLPAEWIAAYIEECMGKVGIAIADYPPGAISYSISSSVWTDFAMGIAYERYGLPLTYPITKKDMQQ